MKDFVGVWLQIIYSHLMDCTLTSWKSLSSLVIFLTLVNGIHQWPVIKWFLPCLTSWNLFAWLESYHLGLKWRTWMVRYSPEYVPILRLRWSIIWSHNMDPHCIFGGCVQYWVWITWVYFVCIIAMFCIQPYWSLIYSVFLVSVM